MRNVLKIRFSGGLGNQLYQLAFLWYLRSKGINAVPDFCEFMYYNFHDGLEINKVLHTVYGQQIEDVEKFRHRCYYFCRDLGLKFCYHWFRLKSRYLNRMLTEAEVKQMKTHELKGLHQAVLKGHWQDLNYVESVKEQFFRQLNYSLLSTPKDREIVRQIKDTVSVSVHVRRGDYLKESQYGVIRGFNYYNRAIQLMQKLCPNAVFYVFSDDIEWVRIQMQGYNAVFIDWNKGDDSFKDLLLMSLCRHNIIANSTFSWWGAYLNRNSKKMVVCPDHWMVDEPTVGRVPVDWILIPGE